MWAGLRGVGERAAVLEQDLGQGALLSDLGQQNYVERIRAGIGDRELTLYREAPALVKMQQAPVTAWRPTTRPAGG